LLSTDQSRAWHDVSGDSDLTAEDPAATTPLEAGHQWLSSIRGVDRSGVSFFAAAIRGVRAIPLCLVWSSMRVARGSMGRPGDLREDESRRRRTRRSWRTRHAHRRSGVAS